MPARVTAGNYSNVGEVMHGNCQGCNRLTKHGRYCSAPACQVHADRANANDVRAKAMNPRWKGHAGYAAQAEPDRPKPGDPITDEEILILLMAASA